MIDTESLKKYFKVTQLTKGSSTWVLLRETPSNVFRIYLHFDENTKSYWACTAKNYDDDQTADKLLQYSCKNAQFDNTALKKSAIAGLQVLNFTHLLLVPATYQTLFKIESPEIYNRMRLIIPIFNCEFDGAEPADMFDVIRKDFVPTTDWKRGPHPRVYMRYFNQKTKSKSRNKGFGIATQNTLNSELRLLPPEEQSFVEIKNLLGSCVRIQAKSGVWVATDGTVQKEFKTIDDVINWADEFLLLNS